MKDEEARYLIDQFNKYASWSLREVEIFQIVWPLGLAGVAVLLSLTSYLNAVGHLEASEAAVEILGYLVVASVLALVLLTGLFLRRHELRYKSCTRRIIALEDYRFKHKSLPDTITFSLIVEKPEELEKLLKDSEPSPT